MVAVRPRLPPCQPEVGPSGCLMDGKISRDEGSSKKYCSIAVLWFDIHSRSRSRVVREAMTLPSETVDFAGSQMGLSQNLEPQI